MSFLDSHLNKEHYAKVGYTGTGSVEIPKPKYGDLFLNIIKKLESKFSIDRALLAILEADGTRFIATTTFSKEKTRRNLSLRIPTVSSLFKKVAEGGLAFSEECVLFFSGNRFERNLLIDDDTESYILLPLKHDGQIIAIVGLSSHEQSAFTAFEHTRFEKSVSSLVESISSIQTVAGHSG